MMHNQWTCVRFALVTFIKEITHLIQCSSPFRWVQTHWISVIQGVPGCMCGPLGLTITCAPDLLYLSACANLSMHSPVTLGVRTSSWPTL